MSARQAFIPRPPSSSEARPHSTDTHDRDGDRDMFVNGTNGKARSIAALLGHKRGTGPDTGSQGARSTQGPGLGTGTLRRSFDGLLRPEMTPMSIVPYPATKQQINTGGNQPASGQTPRKTVGQGSFEFPRPLTPASMPRGIKNGYKVFAEGREENILSGNSVVFMGPGGDADMREGAGGEIGGYMRVFEGFGDGRSADGVQSSLSHDIVAPVPMCALGAQDMDTEDVRYEAETLFRHQSRSIDAISETEAGTEKGNDSQRNLGGTKRGMRAEDAEPNGWYTDEAHQTQAKRMRHVQHDPDEYLPISSPHIPPTPVPPNTSVDALGPSVIASALLENIGECINLEEIETNWKRWKECSTEEWLKAADNFAQEYTEILNMVKGHFAEKVTAYANMISSVEERRKEVDRNIEIINAKGGIVRENISQLGMRK